VLQCTQHIGKKAAVVAKQVKHSLDGDDAPLHVCQLLEGPDTDVHVVHVTAAPALVAVVVVGVLAGAGVCGEEGGGIV
jgi:hypothetical protein